MLRKTNVILAAMFLSLMLLTATTTTMSQVVRKPKDPTGPGGPVGPGPVKTPDCDIPVRDLPVRDQMAAEGLKYDIKLDKKIALFYLKGDVTSVFMPVVGRQKLTEREFMKGATTGRIYVESGGKARIPDGHYRLQLTLGPKNERETMYLAELFTLDGKSVIKMDVPIPAYIICWKDGLNLCDPLVQIQIAEGKLNY